MDNAHELFGTLDFGLRTGKGASGTGFHYLYQSVLMRKRIPGFQNRDPLLQS